MSRRIIFILSLGFVCLAAFICSPVASENLEGSQIKYIFISSKELAHTNELLRRNIRTPFPNAEETYLEYNSPEAKRYIKELDIKFVPFVIYDDSIITTDMFPHLIRNKMIDGLKGYYIIPDEQLKRGEIMFLERKRKSDELYIFAMGFCPYSRNTEVKLINFIRQNKLDIRLNLKYLVNIDESEISSLYGPNELQEDTRQIIIQKYYPDKFLDYLLLAQNKTTEEALEELGLSLENVDSKKEEALKILREHFRFSKNLGITHSPTFLWENVYLIPDAEGLKQHRPFNKKEARLTSKELTAGPVSIEFFYSKDCRSCQKIKRDLLPKIKSRYKDKIEITYHNISDMDEFKLQLSLEKKYGILGGAIPQVFLPTVALEGADMIRKNLAGAIEEILDKQAQTATPKKIAAEENPILEKFSTYSPAVVTFAGLVDGLNPCAFATIIFFVSFLTLNSYRKKQITYIGSAFIAAVFLTYLALGFGIFTAFKKLQIFSFFSQLIYYVIASLALGLGIYSLCDYITYKRTGGTRGCSLKLVNRLRSMVDNRRGLIVLIIAAFVNGFIIALLESACTGQVYFPTIAFVVKISKLRMHAFLYLVLYNIAFILPLVIIFLLAYKGVTSEKVASFTNRHLGRIKMATTLLFFGLAIFLFLF